MKFGNFPVSGAAGAVLAHSIKFAGRTLKKGRVLGREDIEALAEAGIEAVVAAFLEPDDVAENDAANRLAQAICGAHLERSEAFTGRVNLYARSAGLALLDVERLHCINNVHESLTIATLAPFAVVQPGQMVATIKVIPYAAPLTALQSALSIAAGAQVVSVAAFHPLLAGLVMTRLPHTKESVLLKGSEVITERVERLRGRILRQSVVPHEASQVAAAVTAMIEAGATSLLISGIAATSDRDDVVPAAIKQLGGEIIHFGMPVDPGNLLLLARIGETPVIGLPSCARSAKLNGFDFVLQRLAAALPLGSRDIAAMGVGGLLTEIPSRPMPRDRHPAPPRAPRLAAIVLAAGESRRMGEANKLLALLRGKPLILHTVEAAKAAGLAPLVVVTGHEAHRVQSLLDDTAVTLVHNSSYAEGLATSLRAGIAALDDGVDGAMVLLGDMPEITGTHLRKMAAAFSPEDGRAIVVPTSQGQWGNPILWARSFFGEMQMLNGDHGAKRIAEENPELVVELELDAAVRLDIDRPEDLDRLLANR